LETTLLVWAAEGPNAALYAPAKPPRPPEPHAVGCSTSLVRSEPPRVPIWASSLQEAGRRLRFGCATRWSMSRIMARVTMASETSGSSS
jgi:hypothetical protein